jgi:hypothetical protein
MAITKLNVGQHGSPTKAKVGSCAVSILCCPATPAVSPLYGITRRQSQYLTSHSAYVPVIIYNRKQRHIIATEMMTLNEIHYNLATSTFLIVKYVKLI